MGLAPQLVAEIFEIVKKLNRKERVSILLAEQNTNIALRYADYGYILENGRVVMDGEAKSLADNEDVASSTSASPPPAARASATSSPIGAASGGFEERILRQAGNACPKRREAALMAELPRLVAHAKKRASGFARILSEVNPSTVRSRAALAKLPVGKAISPRCRRSCRRSAA